MQATIASLIATGALFAPAFALAGTIVGNG